jgi:hypothetical protein
VAIASEPTIAIGRSRLGLRVSSPDVETAVEPDIGEEDHRRGGDDAAGPLGRERPQVVALARGDAEHDEQGEHRQLEHDHDAVGARALADPVAEHRGDR